MVTPITSMPSFDLYYGLNSPANVPTKSGDKTVTIALIMLSIGLAGVTAYMLHKNLKLKMKLEEISK